METHDQRNDLLKVLVAKGVRIPCPESVEIGPDVDPDRISGERVTIHSGCKIYGSKTLIMPGVELGYEAPVTIEDCQLGKGVELKGGFFSRSCFLEGAAVGSGAQIREACLLEEGARAAHTVGLKQTILFPYVTLGSLINFCDCLMSGGTDPKKHSEVGSSYIHFNYSPNQDKATPSLLGDVPQGVMINQPPIFLGGQGGLVGPVRIGFGVVVAAGTIVRKDILVGGRILLGYPSLNKSMPFHPGLFANLKRIIGLNCHYIGNLIALRRWYLDVRSGFFISGSMEAALLKGAVDKLDQAIEERLKRLGEVASRMTQSIEIYRRTRQAPDEDDLIRKKREFHERWPDMNFCLREALDLEGDPARKDAFLGILEKGQTCLGKDYLTVIKGLEEGESRIGTSWLQGLVDQVVGQAWEKLPGFRIKL